jgi:ribosomal protein S18 acetylase RimI-like enzyme
LVENKNDTAFVIREVVEEGIPALAQLHVITWADTYKHHPSPPTYEIREYQWRTTFELNDGSWFCFVIENSNKEMVGFAKGILKKNNTAFPGELNKIYLLRQYHGRGLGKRLVGHVARRFIEQGIFAMLLFAEPDNPTCGFYEALGAEKLFTDKGEFHGSYGWRDLKALAAVCDP